MAKYVLLIKSIQKEQPATEDSDELSTFEKLKAALEERVKKATSSLSEFHAHEASKADAWLASMSP